jgi:hypothetical protein
MLTIYPLMNTKSFPAGNPVKLISHFSITAEIRFSAEPLSRKAPCSNLQGT